MLHLTQLSAKSTRLKKKKKTSQLSTKSTWSQKLTWFQNIDSIMVKMDSICATFHLIYLPLTGPSTFYWFYLIWVDPSTIESFFFFGLFDWVDFVDNQVNYGDEHNRFLKWQFWNKRLAIIYMYQLQTHLILTILVVFTRDNYATIC